MSILIMIVLATSPRGEASDSLAAFAGDWVLESMTVRGEKNDLSSRDRIVMTVGKDGGFHFKEGERRVVQGKIERLDPKTSPAEIDWTIASRSEFDGSFRPVHAQKGVFIREKNTLRLCMTVDPKGNRPTGFDEAKAMEAAVYHWRLQDDKDKKAKSS